MDVFMIWATNNERSHYWLVDAWDSDTVSENRSGYEGALDKAYAEHGPGNIVVASTSVNFDAIVDRFGVVEV